MTPTVSPSEASDRLTDPDNRILYDALTRQLERMRSMHYGYYAQFFSAIHIFTALILAQIALSLWAPMRALILALPFFVIYAGSFCAYLISYNLFARVYADASGEADQPDAGAGRSGGAPDGGYLYLQRRVAEVRRDRFERARDGDFRNYDQLSDRGGCASSDRRVPGGAASAGADPRRFRC